MEHNENNRSLSKSVQLSSAVLLQDTKPKKTHVIPQGSLAKLVEKVVSSN